MVSAEIKQEILDFLNQESPSMNAGVDLWRKYGKNKALDRLFFRGSARYFDKLRYELSKIAGISLTDFNAGNFSGAKVIPMKTGYPEIIIRIKDEIETLYPQLVDKQKQLTDLGDGNNDETKAKAAELGESIDALNTRYVLLYDAKEKYFLEEVWPDENVLYPVVDDTDPYELKKLNGAGLMSTKKNLESSLTKDRNLLLYQTKTKGTEENPMAQGDERTAIEARIANKTSKLDAINALLDAAKV